VSRAILIYEGTGIAEGVDGSSALDEDKAKLQAKIKEAISKNFPGVLLMKTQAMTQTPL
jgi:hypothetical protein